jgi:hypothetical protein
MARAARTSPRASPNVRVVLPGCFVRYIAMSEIGEPRDVCEEMSGVAKNRDAVCDVSSDYLNTHER